MFHRTYFLLLTLLLWDLAVSDVRWCFVAEAHAAGCSSNDWSSCWSDTTHASWNTTQCCLGTDGTFSFNCSFMNETIFLNQRVKDCYVVTKVITAWQIFNYFTISALFFCLCGLLRPFISIHRQMDSLSQCAAAAPVCDVIGLSLSFASLLRIWSPWNDLECHLSYLKSFRILHFS